MRTYNPIRETGWERTTRFHGNFTPPMRYLSSARSSVSSLSLLFGHLCRLFLALPRTMHFLSLHFLRMAILPAEENYSLSILDVLGVEQTSSQATKQPT